MPSPTLSLLLLMLAALPGATYAQQADPALQGSLKGLSLEQLGNIEVTTVSKAPVTIARTPAAVFVITQEDIRRSGALSLPEALRLAPGVEVARIDSVKWAIGIRGFESRLSRAVLVLIDGRSVYSPLFHGVYWEVQDTLMADVDRIEVVRGTGGTIWGPDAVDGVINIITKSARETHGALVSAGGGDVEQGFVDFRYGGGNNRNFSYRFYGKGQVRGPEFHPNNHQFDDSRRTQGGFRADWEATGRDTVTIQGDLYTGEAGESVRITTMVPASSSIVYQNAELSGGNVVARWKRVLGAGSDIQVQAYFDRANRRQSNQAEYRDTYDFDLLHHLTLRGRQDFSWGMGARISAAYLPTVVPTFVFTPDRRTDQLYSGFAQDEIRLIPDRLSLTIGAKLLHSSFTGYDTEPSVRLLWTPSTHQSVWAAVTRAVRTPSDLEDTLQSTSLRSTSPLVFNRTVGDGMFTSETVLAYEIGYRKLVKSNLSLDLATFYNRYDHLLSVEPGASFAETSQGTTYLVQPFVNRNGLLGTTKGFEITPSWKPTAAWRLQGSYSYLDMNLESRPGSLDRASASSIEGSSPRHQVAVQSFLDLPHHLEFSQGFRFNSGVAAQQTASYETAGARIAWHVNTHLDFSVTARNLFQPHHAEYGGDPGGLVEIKRNLFAAFTWRQ